jgi:phosphatidylethanolamine/phosphatidyl-N-methylethanolamine N-methyltransferase
MEDFCEKFGSENFCVQSGIESASMRHPRFWSAMHTPTNLNFAFLRRFVAKPFKVASPVPSGRDLARRVAAQIDLNVPGPILELGAGTGAVTEAILGAGAPRERLIAVEQDDEFVSLLKQQFQAITVVKGDAFAISDILRSAGVTQLLSAIVCGLPVLSRPPEIRAKLIDDAAVHLRKGGRFIQFSYSAKPPLPSLLSMNVQHAATAWRNFPPMHIWTYTVLGP